MSDKYKKLKGLMTHFSDTEERWTTVNPRTIPNVMYYSSDTKKFKMGTGAKWINVDYTVSDSVPVGALLYSVSKIVPDKYLPVNGCLVNRYDYRKLFDLAVKSQIIIEESDWRSNPSLCGYFSYSDNIEQFRVPCIDSMMLRSWIPNSSRNNTDPGGYMQGTAITADLPDTNKLMYGVEFQPDNRNIYDTIGVDQPLVQLKNISSTSVSGIVDKTHGGVMIGVVRPETISYPLYIKYE